MKHQYIVKGGLKSGKDFEIIKLARRICIRNYGFAWIFLKKQAKIAMLQEVIDFSCEVFKDFKPHYVDVDNVFGLKNDR